MQLCICNYAKLLRTPILGKKLILYWSGFINDYTEQQFTQWIIDAVISHIALN